MCRARKSFKIEDSIFPSRVMPISFVSSVVSSIKQVQEMELSNEEITEADNICLAQLSVVASVSTSMVLLKGNVALAARRALALESSLQACN